MRLKCFSELSPDSSYLCLCRPTVHQWRPGLHLPRGPSDQGGHGHPLRSRFTGRAHQNPLQHQLLAGQCAECNRFGSLLVVSLGWGFERGAHGTLCSPGNPLSLADLVPLIQRTLKDESSVTCKMACAAVKVRQIRVGLLERRLGLGLTLGSVAALHHDSVQQHPEWAGPAACHRPLLSEGLLLLACSHWTPGNLSRTRLQVGKPFSILFLFVVFQFPW